MHEEWGRVEASNGDAGPRFPNAMKATQVIGKSNKRRSWIIAIAALVGVLVVLVGIKGGQIGAMIKAGKSFTIPPESVTSAKVEATEWQQSRSAVGTLIAFRDVELGQVLSPGSRIASLQSVDPVHADFWLPQQALADLTQGMRSRLRTDVFPKQAWDGAVTTINPEVDVSTRNVRVRGTFPNADGRLRPGMFVNVDVISPEKRRVLLIPSTAVLYAPYGDSVFAIEEKKNGDKATLTAHQKFVRLGERRGDLVA